MKKLFVAFAMLIGTCTAFAQGAHDYIMLGVADLQPTEELTDNTIRRLDMKITQIIDNSHEAVNGYNDFVIFPAISVDESSMVEGGLQNIVVSTISITFTIRQQSTGTAFGAITKKVKGSGNNKADAIFNAIGKINTSDASFASFIAAAKIKILRYYSSNCHSIVAAAASAETRKDYEQAIGILQSVPPPAPCYDEAQRRLGIAYNKYQKANCAKNIYDAKTRIAAKDYSNALETLRLIDPTAECGKDAERLLSEIDAKVEKDDMKAYSLEQQRITAMQAIAKAYYAHSGRRR